MDMLYKILKKITKCFAYKKYGHTYVKCVINPIKVRKFNVNRINKNKDKILLIKCFGGKQFMRVINYFNFSTFYRKY
jgi:hypothetical protein